MASMSVPGWQAIAEIASKTNVRAIDLSSCQIKDLDAYCEFLLNGKPSLKLWGTPRPTRCGEGRIALAVDKRTGGKVTVEIYPEIVCFYQVEP